jgi:isoquinoline 1-oxidoreductase subunit beta
MSAETSYSRRDALRAGAALVLGFRMPLRAENRGAASTDTDALKPNAWVRITRDDRITILTDVPELGQGTRTAGVMLLADELEVEWSSIRWEQAPTIPEVYKTLTTGGSGGLKSLWLPMRKAGAGTVPDSSSSAMGRGQERLSCRQRSDRTYAYESALAIWRAR